MHSLIHLEYARADAAERRRRAIGPHARAVRPQPPPLRRRAARAVGRLAHRLDAEAARQAVT